jgi:uncharacterized protein
MNAQTLIFQQLKTAMPLLREKYPIRSIALFGSVVRDDFDPKKSDIDIMVDFSNVSFDIFLNLADELEALFGRKVDMITKDSLKPRHWEYLHDKVIYA